jgi:hypothetical protein
LTRYDLLRQLQPQYTPPRNIDGTDERHDAPAENFSAKVFASLYGSERKTAFHARGIHSIALGTRRSKCDTPRVSHPARLDGSPGTQSAGLRIPRTP